MPARTRTRTATDQLPGSFDGHRTDPLLKVLSVLSRVYINSVVRLPQPKRDLAVNPQTHDVTVVRRTVLAEDENVVQLDLRGAGPLPSWTPGAHIDVTLPSGRFRQYSLCGDPQNLSSYRIATRLVPDGDGGSREMHEEVGIGTRLRISTPRNAFPFAVGIGRHRPSYVRFIAGGIGITPILPMVALADRLGLDWTLVYVGRHADSLAFLDVLAAYGSRVRVRLDSDEGVPTAADVLDEVPDGAEVYCCGPVPLLDLVHAAIRQRPTVGFHFERFAPPPIVDGHPFQIELSSDGTVVDVPADRTALEAVRAVRPDVFYSCRQGFCGTCRTPVLAGKPEHHGTALTADEQCGEMLLCVSRAESERIVIDL